MDLEMVRRAVLAAVGFSLVSSSVYIINDLRDREQDRLHPTKRNRPLASGALSATTGMVFAVILFISGISISYLAFPTVTILVFTYFIINSLYSLGLKHIVILDVFLIAAGFMMRILAGTLGIGIEPSHWLLFCGLTVTLFLGFCKRRAELLIQTEGEETRRVLAHYNPQLLDLMIAVMLACVILSYSLYTIDSRTVNTHGTHELIFTVPFVIYAMFRYLYLLHTRGGGEDTARDLVRDPHILVTVILWAASVIFLIS